MYKKNVKPIIKGVGHVGYTTNVLDSAIDFYCNKLGIENKHIQLNDRPYLSKVTGFVKCCMKVAFVNIENDISFEILEYLNPKGLKFNNDFKIVGSSHICWQVDNLFLIKKRLEEVGVEFISGIKTIEFGLWKGSKGIFLKNNDDQLIELVECDSFHKSAGHLIRMHHVSFTVSNLDDMLNFMCNKLGLCLVKKVEVSSYYTLETDKPDSMIKVAYVSLSNTSLIIELREFCTGNNEHISINHNMVGNVHLCFLVDDVHSKYKELTEKNIEFVGPPADITAGINKGGYAIYFKGPDGIRCELFQQRP